eukprot:TRINITY_DN3280_c0_g4_i1.p1 TRINITY_DN3280_c0_g4~~TRINITY_DN3280_c0_g4_i1.p1  ORF type:complete len:592 (+),score=194.63 TRINITY_DN3280_c0_g4_i1:194-1969(+)
MMFTACAVLLAAGSGNPEGCPTADDVRMMRNGPRYPKHGDRELLRFDDFGRSGAQQTAFGYSVWPNLTAQSVVPASLFMQLPSATVGLAEDVEVPTIDETWPSPSQEEANTSAAYGESLPFPHAGWLCGSWYKGEDKMAKLADLMTGARNPERTLVRWGDEKYTDEGFSAFVFQGIGQHRVEKVRAGDVCARGATYAVYLSDAEALEVKPGLARLGGDAYFNEHGIVTHIRRLGRFYYPSQPGWERHTTTDLSRRECAEVGGRCRRWFMSSAPCVCRVPARLGFKSAKMAFLGTLSVVITAIDHLYGVHLSVSNAIVTSNVQALPTSHPLRTLMHPHTFRAAVINYRASFQLVNEYSHLHRSTALTETGLRQLFKYAQTEAAGLGWKTVPERHAAQGFTAEDKVKLPLHEDGGDYYAVVRKYVHGYLSAHYNYAENQCGADTGIQAWMSRANSIAPQHDLPVGDAVTCETLEDVLATFIYTVTGGHTHVGQIVSEVEDPCHAPWAWREGELCGPPRTTFTQLLLLESTAFPQPKLMDDFTHLFPEEADKQRWVEFQADLQEFKERVAARNSNRARMFRSFDMDVMEVSVGI